jgi:hypothetical protein
MTEYQPTPQTPEQVDTGLRNAFRQAMKDGVMDATPYLKQMTFNTDIEKTEAEIKVLQKKLELLKEIETHKSPVEKAYKDWWGQYPELETDSKYDDTRWQGFQAGFQAAYEEKIKEDDYYNEVECDEKDNPASYITDEVVNRLVEKHKSQKLWNILSNKYDYISATCDDIVSAVEEWLPKEQSAAGSQNVDTELLVDGFNDCLRKIKEMLR